MHRLHGASQLLEIAELKTILVPVEAMDEIELTNEYCLSVLKSVRSILQDVSEEITIICPADIQELPDR